MTRPKIELGRMLFFEKRFSADGTVSCASCHDPARGFSNGRQYGVGVGGKLGKRNVPTIVNAAYNDHQFWDGRARSLEEQARGPILHPAEMASSEARIAKTLGASSSYREAFRAAFGSEEISLERVAQAVATFERTVLSGNSPFDRWKYGRDERAVPEAAKRGFEIFRVKGKCVKCHLVDEFSAPFTDNKFHNVGVGMEKNPPQIGRGEITRKPQDRGKFKTPTLREITQTAPYMHDGRFATLEEVIDYYDRGGNSNPHLDPDIVPLKLTAQEKKDLLAFLHTLKGEIPPVSVPEKMK